MKKFFILGMVSLLMTGLGEAKPETNVVPDDSISLENRDVRAMEAKAERILAEMNKLGDGLHLKFFGPVNFQPNRAADDEKFFKFIGCTGFQLMRQGGPGISISSETSTFTFQKSTNQLIKYQNLQLIDQVRGQSAVILKKPDVAQWSHAYAIKVATAFLPIFTDPLKVKLGVPSTYFDNTPGTAPKFYRGEWTVKWPRVDSRGHPFYDDNVVIRLLEGYVPLEVGENLATPFTEEGKEPISQADALEKAKNSNEFIKKFKPQSPTDKLIENKLTDASLKVVPVDDHNRLAWVIWFHQTHSEKMGSWDNGFSFAIWVDAYTGKIIGTDSIPTF